EHKRLSWKQKNMGNGGANITKRIEDGAKEEGGGTNEKEMIMFKMIIQMLCIMVVQAQQKEFKMMVHKK
ncbi:hypothetical protein M8C21_021071, partial [Ambrosia artemisiifolia]